MTTAVPEATLAAVEAEAPALPEAAIEAAAKALYDFEPWRKNTYNEDTFTWDELADGDRESFRKEATVALTAAHVILSNHYEALVSQRIQKIADDYMGEFPFMRKVWRGEGDPVSDAARSIAAKTLAWLRKRA